MTFSDAVVVVLVWFVNYVFLGPIIATIITVIAVALGLYLKNKQLQSEEE